MFDKKTTPKVLKITSHDINEYIYNIINNDVNDYFSNNDGLMNEIVNISKNNNGEIIMMDYNLSNVYKMSKNVNKIIGQRLKIKLKNNNFGMVYFGQILDSSFFNYYGPKIIYKYNFKENNITSIKSKVTEYGLNNVLLEIYMNLRVNVEVITPIRDSEMVTSVDLLLNSKVINGRIPQIYGTSFERQADLINTLNE